MRSSFFALALVFTGCTSANPQPPAAFLGTWSFSGGSTDYACPTGNSSQGVTGNLTIKAGVDSDLVVLDSEGCNFGYSVAGDVATAQNMKCSRPAPELGQGVTADTTFRDIELTTSDGKTMTDTYGGTVTLTSAQGKLDCSFSGTATLKKVSAQ